MAAEEEGGSSIHWHPMTSRETYSSWIAKEEEEEEPGHSGIALGRFDNSCLCIRSIRLPVEY